MQEALIAYYNNSSFVATLTQNNTVTVTYTNSPTDNNGDENIDVPEKDALIVRYVREWELLNQECNKICNPEDSFVNNACAINEEILLNDLRLDGQYGATSASAATSANIPYELSVFNNVSKLYYLNPSTGVATTSGNNWKKPVSEYKNEDGVLSLVEIKPDSTTASQSFPEIDETTLAVYPKQQFSSTGMVQSLKKYDHNSCYM